VNLNALIKYINSIIALLCLTALALAYWYAWRPMPAGGGTVQAPVGAAAKVVRDNMGVPHIEAASDQDAYFLQGYVTAQDRLFQMEFARRQAAGELAAIFGMAAVESDMETRRLRMRRVAAQHARTLPPADRAVMAAYARGVNFYLETHQGRLPVEFTLLGVDPAPWTIPDTILIGLHMFRSLTTTWKDEALKSSYLAQGDAAKVNFLFPVRTGAEPQPGSNAWVLSGKRTASGKPILANDPHLGFSLPGVWYQVHLKTPSMNVAGVSIPGSPAVIIGHNDRIAWGMTNLHFDVQDLYMERLNIAAGAYLFEGQAKPLRQEKEFVRIRGGAQSEFLVTSTGHGPIQRTGQGQPLSIRWTATEPGLFQFPFAELNHARDWSQFRAALSRFPGPGQNFVYADTEGNIGYQATGKLPIRRDRDGDLPADGTSGKQEWDGFIPFDELPSVYNPESGLIVTANQNPFPANYPYRVSGNFAPHYRATQIRQMLSAKPAGWKAEEMLRVQKDVYSSFSHYLAKETAAAYKRRGLRNQSLSPAAELLERWDGQMEKGTAAPLLVTLVFQQVRKAVADRASGGKGSQYESQMAASVIEQLLRTRPKDWFMDYDQMLLRALMDAVRDGTKLQGGDLSKWDYGQYNQLVLRNPVVAEIPLVGRYFQIGPAPMSGSSTTVKQTTPRLGPSMRMVADLASWDQSLLNLTTGESGHPLSSHYKDQWESYYAGRSFPMQFGKIEASGTLEFVPLEPAR